ncbi:serine protease 42-like [Macrobrachium rosenbergii]|uniref:serine protease 42-like n=1 Tax=Macrobrachium rosenbergii TaxID=79674 RepID=UPI0034D7BBB5
MAWDVMSREKPKIDPTRLEVCGPVFCVYRLCPHHPYNNLCTWTLDEFGGLQSGPKTKVFNFTSNNKASFSNISSSSFSNSRTKTFNFTTTLKPPSPTTARSSPTDKTFNFISNTKSSSSNNSGSSFSNSKTKSNTKASFSNNSRFFSNSRSRIKPTLSPTLNPPSPTTAAPPPTTVGPSPIPSTLPPTTAAPATVSPGTESSASPPTTGGPPSPTESPTGPPSPPTNSATEMQTATTVPSTTTACNASRAYCSDCGIAPINVVGYKIVNGLDASPDEYPYQVIVVPTINGAQYQCGGSIIKKRWVLTAAHCFFDRSGNQPSQNGVVVGYGNINQYLTTQVSSTRYIVHENYDSTTHANDIALIELPSDLNFVNNPAVQPICLAVESDIPYGGKAVATGWGTLVYQGTTLPVILQEVALDIINISQCQPLVSLPTDTSTVLCALTPTKDTCQGDSGGPLVAKVCPNKWVQIGIVSYGYRCAYPDNPGVYTRVSAFRQWIDVNTGSSTSC